MGANKMDAEVIDRDRIEVFVSSSMPMKTILAGSS